MSWKVETQLVNPAPTSELIYVAGPYGAPTEEERLANVKRALDVAAELVRLGHQPYVPHTSHYEDEHFQASGITLPWAWWLKRCARMLSAFDALFYLAPSKGADVELFIALSHGIKVYHDISHVKPTSDCLLKWASEYQDKGR